MKPSQRFFTILVSLLLVSWLPTPAVAGPPGKAQQRKAITHTAWAYVFLSSKIERVEETNLTRSRKLSAKAARHYERAYFYGLEGLERRHPGFVSILEKNPGDAITLTFEEDVPLLYWTAAALGSAVGLSKDRPDMLIRLPQVGALAHRAAQLQPNFMNGAIYELLMLYEASRPGMLGGSVALAKRYYQQALDISGGGGASLFVSYATTICVQEQDRECFIAMLSRALEVKGGGPTSRMARKRAKWLLERVDDYFL